MKHLIVSIILFVSFSFAQVAIGNNTKIPRMVKDQNNVPVATMFIYDQSTDSYYPVGYTANYGLPMPVAIDPDGANSVTVAANSTINTYSYNSKTIDTGTYTIHDTVSVKYFRGNHLFGIVNLRNSNTIADTVLVEMYDTVSAVWTSQAIGLRDLSSDIVLTNPIVLPASTLKSYLIDMPYPRTYRTRFNKAWSSATRSVVVTWIGKQ